MPKWLKRPGFVFVIPLGMIVAAFASSCLPGFQNYDSDSIRLAVRTYLAATAIALVMSYAIVGLAKLAMPSRIQFLPHAFRLTPWLTLLILLLMLIRCALPD
ncbi:MAG: hypothetical protein RLZ98_2522 [Pseudomonadota bacterium]|jgi:hypothetical protein